MWSALLHAFRWNVDFRWFSAYLVARHMNPWDVFLEGFPRAFIQQPLYLHELCILLLPFGLMDETHAMWAWALTNLVMTIVSVYVLARFFRLSNDDRATVFLLLASSAAFRGAVGTGQQVMLILLMYALFLHASSAAGKGTALGISYLKYSFAPVWTLFLLMRRRYRVVLVSLIPPIVGWLLTWWMVGGNAWHVLMGPYRTAQYGVTGGVADVHTLVRFLGFSQNAGVVAGFALSAIAAWYLARRELTPGQEACTLAAASLMFLYHGRYDFVLLTPVVAYALTLPRRPAVWLLGLVAFFWYTPARLWVDPQRSLAPHWSVIPGFILLGVMLALLTRKSFAADEAQPASSEPSLTAESVHR